MKAVVVVAFLILGLVCGDKVDKKAPSRVITTPSGPIRGIQEKTSQNTAYFSFKSIPYAKPPIGDLRFQPPEPVDPWTGILEARADGPPCIQVPPFIEEGTVGSEDCLWLSVFARDVPLASNNTIRKPLKPVMVWIHGGRFLVGTARTELYSPEFVMEYGNDVILVSIQHRLGALGFLSTEDGVAPGNYGLLDQVLALKWIRDNIKSFGGDPKRVTIVGQSAGAASVHAHMFSPLSKGLFHGAVSLSGSANMAWASRFSARVMAQKQAQLVNCPVDQGSQAMVDCLRQVDAETLTRSQQDLHVMFKKSPAKLPITLFYPRVDKEASEPFLPLDPAEILKSGRYESEVPWLTGLTKQEGAWYSVHLFGPAFTERWETFIQNWEYSLKNIAAEDFFSLEAVKKVHDHYFSGEQQLNQEQQRYNMTQLITDFGFAFEGLMAVHQHAQKRMEASPVYLFKFDFSGQYSFTQLFDPGTDYGGPAHADDLRYLMKTKFTPNKRKSDQIMAKDFTQMVLAFVRDGVPRFQDQDLPKYQSGQAKYLVLDGDSDQVWAKVSQDMPFALANMKLCKELYGYDNDFFDDFSSDAATARDEL